MNQCYLEASRRGEAAFDPDPEHAREGRDQGQADTQMRRVRIGMWQPSLLPDLIPRLEGLMRDELGWGAARWHQEHDHCLREAASWRPVS